MFDSLQCSALFLFFQVEESERILLHYSFLDFFFSFKKSSAYKYLSHGLSFHDSEEKFKIGLYL